METQHIESCPYKDKAELVKTVMVVVCNAIVCSTMSLIPPYRRCCYCYNFFRESSEEEGGERGEGERYPLRSNQSGLSVSARDYSFANLLL